jgi:hypothetical protein
MGFNLRECNGQRSEFSLPACVIWVLVLLGATVGHANPLEEPEATRAHRLTTMLHLAPPQPPPPATPDESIAHVRTVEKSIIDLSRASLTLVATLARLQHEEYEAKSAHDLLEAHRLGRVARWSIAAVIVGEGASIVGTGMQFGSETVKSWGNGVVIAGAAVAAAFSIVALANRDRGSLPLSVETNLLASLLDRQPTQRSRYPAWIWSYLDTPSAGEARSIRQELIDKWTREGKLGGAHGLTAERRLALLTEPLRSAQRIDAVVLEERATMLADVRERLATLSEDLELLWSEVHSGD